MEKSLIWIDLFWDTSLNLMTAMAFIRHQWRVIIGTSNPKCPTRITASTAAGLEGFWSASHLHSVVFYQRVIPSNFALWCRWQGNASNWRSHYYCNRCPRIEVHQMRKSWEVCVTIVIFAQLISQRCPLGQRNWSRPAKTNFPIRDPPRALMVIEAIFYFLHLTYQSSIGYSETIYPRGFLLYWQDSNSH
jgi:hypothetical protein